MKDVFFGPEGAKLHGLLVSADKPGAPGAVLCHPHPGFGGDMDNNVVLGVAASLVEADFNVLRFNFRGVGRSKGPSTGGERETEDVQWAVEMMAADPAVGPLFVVGYSFGAAMGLKAAAGIERVQACVAVAPPNTLYSFDFTASIKKPLLMIAGSHDDYCDIESLRATAVAAGAKLEIIPGEDHFLIGAETRAGELTRDFLLGCAGA